MVNNVPKKNVLKNIQSINRYWRKIMTLLSIFSEKQRPLWKITNILGSENCEVLINITWYMSCEINPSWTNQFGVVKCSFCTKVHHWLKKWSILVNNSYLNHFNSKFYKPYIMFKIKSRPICHKFFIILWQVKPCPIQAQTHIYENWVFCWSKSSKWDHTLM